jgi:hypothetical protein
VGVEISWRARRSVLGPPVGFAATGHSRGRTTMTWGEFVEAAPDLAAVGRTRLLHAPAYLATTRAEGRPRVHPVTPILTDDQLFVFMEPTSPKGRDLRERGDYALHCRVDDVSGGEGEFWVAGRGRVVDDAAVRQLAATASSYTPAARYVLFELEIDEARSTTYMDGQPRHDRWSEART